MRSMPECLFNLIMSTYCSPTMSLLSCHWLYNKPSISPSTEAIQLGRARSGCTSCQPLPTWTASTWSVPHSATLWVVVWSLCSLPCINMICATLSRVVAWSLRSLPCISMICATLSRVVVWSLRSLLPCIDMICATLNHIVSSCVVIVRPAMYQHDLCYTQQSSCVVIVWPATYQHDLCLCHTQQSSRVVIAQPAMYQHDPCHTQPHCQ